ncbi:putative toxin-antitoxin system toxin component, PIN family [Piscinibacter gummiphilus]|uniref:Toxin-antitoxin system toxin component, PIN family n=1 Tax=Piscinibacter gummiphilus TaxID=946333 RepID=A0ABZ0CSF3_9BURK|nr:putative toxin-antitoxin system toxin component, PIN family [Piscinibacter gummiphilus]WOB07915.1 putative toxin-antitoxin system toxin component, PIN family [Piscinibacter gummiphilus]
MVLDTNVVMDWLVFRNADGQALFGAIERRELRWVVTTAMHDELLHVLGRGVAASYSPDLERINESWCLLSETIRAPEPQGEASRLRCTDVDDQKFVDLAVAEARWLISRDRAVLKLARRAGRLGLQVIPPGRWQPA